MANMLNFWLVKPVIRRDVTIPTNNHKTLLVGVHNSGIPLIHKSMQKFGKGAYSLQKDIIV